jgi:hypothetical protein
MLFKKQFTLAWARLIAIQANQDWRRYNNGSNAMVGAWVRVLGEFVNHVAIGI